MLDISDTTPLKDLKRGAAGETDDLPELFASRSSLHLSVEAAVPPRGELFLFQLLLSVEAKVPCNECLLKRFRFKFFFLEFRVGSALGFVHLEILRLRHLRAKP